MEVSEYTYKLPDDYEMKPKHREKLDRLVTRFKLTNAEAQKAVDLHVELVEEYAKELKKAIVPTVIFFVTISIVGAAVGAALLSLL